MKLASQITDRAKRYRANRAYKLKTRCECTARNHAHGAICGSLDNLGIGHRDGNESNGRKSNLFTVCKSCNAMQAHDDKKAGRGVRTRQYNSGRRRNRGARSLGEYVSAAVSHVRGAHDEAGKLIHETPKAKRREFAAEIWRRRGRNPETLTQAQADELYRKFHGAKPDSRLAINAPSIDPYGEHPDIAQFGLLVRLVVGEGIEVTGSDDSDEFEVEEVADDFWWFELCFVPSLADYKRRVRGLRTQSDIDQFKSWLRKHGTPDLAGEPGANQIYIAGGNQDVSALLKKVGSDPNKETADLGYCYMVEYFTQKRFDRMQPVDYYHSFGETSGVMPRLMYWRNPGVLQLVGGEYTIKPSGINN